MRLRQRGSCACDQHGPDGGMKRFLRGCTILWVVFRYGLDALVLDSFQKALVAHVLSHPVRRAQSGRPARASACARRWSSWARSS